MRRKLSGPRTNWGTLVGVGLLVFQAVCPVRGAEGGAERESVKVQGRVVCLAAPEHLEGRTGLPQDHVHRWGVKTDQGTRYVLKRTPGSEALYEDARLRQRPLQLQGQPSPDGTMLEVTKFWGLREGQPVELYYWCDVCAIKSFAPGECVCCREPVELREGKVEGRP